jgi:hypothetical protein
MSCITNETLMEEEGCLDIRLINEYVPVKIIDGEVCKIITLDNYYLIYIRSNERMYKVLSFMDINDTCQEIQLNSIYTFSLQLQENSLNPHITGVSIGEALITYREGDSIRGLYFSQNLKGICIYSIDTLKK